jgi:cobalt/nickel transport system permease protein
MQLQFRDHLATDSCIGRMDARWRLAAIVLVMAAIAPLRSLTAAAAAFAMAMALLILSGLSVRWYASRLAGVLLFLLLVLVVLPFTMSGDMAPLGPVEVSLQGLQAAGRIILKALALVALALVLLACCPFEQTAKAMHALRVPGLLVQLLLLTYRYVRLFAEQLHKLRLALRTRGYRNRMNRHSYRTIAHVSGTLLVRSYERAERVSQAMRSRGYDGRWRHLGVFTTRPADVLQFLLIVVAIGAGPWVLELLR